MYKKTFINKDGIRIEEICDMVDYFDDLPSADLMPEKMINVLKSSLIPFASNGLYQSDGLKWNKKCTLDEAIYLRETIVLEGDNVN